MKILSVQFPDDTEISIPRGDEGIKVTDGTNTIEGGKLIAIVDMEDPEFVPPTEPITVTIGPPASE